MRLGKPKLKLPYGLRDDRLIHISELSRDTERGRNCRCVCPSCKRPLRAHMGDVMKTHYFAHDTEGDSCETALESALHILAKEILAQEKCLAIPALVAPAQEELGFDPDPLQLASAQIWAFQEAKLEVHLGNMVPDVILSDGQTKLFVEVGVTHFCDQEKKQKITKRGVSTIEISLRDLHKNGFNRSEVADRLLKDTSFSQWVFNAKGEELIRTKVEEILQKRADQKRRQENINRAFEKSRRLEQERQEESRRKERERRERQFELQRRLAEKRREREEREKQLKVEQEKKAEAERLRSQELENGWWLDRDIDESVFADLPDWVVKDVDLDGPPFVLKCPDLKRVIPRGGTLRRGAYVDKDCFQCPFSRGFTRNRTGFVCLDWYDGPTPLDPRTVPKAVSSNTVD